MPDRIRSPMPAITLWQPWASLIAAGAKPFEFRSWPAPRCYRGKRIAIHAGARPVRHAEIADLLWQIRCGEPGRTALLPDVAIPLLESALTSPGSIWRSAVVCTAILGVPVRNEEMYSAFAERGIAVNDSNRSEHTNWAWPLREIEPIEPPIPARGAMGFWRWTAP